jgi:hypothetical protein
MGGREDDPHRTAGALVRCARRLPSLLCERQGVDEGVSTTERNGTTLETGRRSLDVMHKDAKRYASTGGWGYDHFEGDQQVSEATPDVRDACFKCHSTKTDTDSVYSAFRK